MRLSPGCPARLCHSVAEVGGEFLDGAVGALDAVVTRRAADKRGEVVGPRLEAVAVRSRHPQQFGDDRRGQGDGQVGDNVESCRWRRACEQIVDDRLDAFAQPLDDPRGERLGDQPTQPGVLWRIGEDHHVALDLGEGTEFPALLLREKPIGPCRGEACVAQTRVDLAVSHDVPNRRRLVAMHRSRCPKVCIGRVRIRLELWAAEGSVHPLKLIDHCRLLTVAVSGVPR